MAVGIFDTFFDSDSRQRADLDELRTRELAVAHDIAGLRTFTATLQRQVQDLTVFARVLVRMLEEQGQLDTKILRYRVEAELEDVHAAPTSRAIPPAGIAEPPPPATPTRCERCGTIVPAHRTTITEAGTVCDGCVTP
ncbi:MAG: hypothetical protein M3680_26985 [Myxococcota bacterium]|nr:hypothetical protein [Myxococcota bacterium]